jgi:hypothetical protein
MIEGVVMPTVRHTGSLFMVDLLPYERCTLRGKPGEYPLFFDHAYDLHMKHFFKWIEEYPTVVIPLRDPMDCARSWAKRRESFKWFNQMWENLIQFDRFNPFYIPIDKTDKQNRLDALADHLGVELATDWTPINTCSDQAIAIPESVKDVYSLPVIKDFYEI